MDELWEEIKKSTKSDNIDKIITEAIQVGAMAIAIILKCQNIRLGL